MDHLRLICHIKKLFPFSSLEIVVSSSKYLFIIVTCIYKLNINIHIMVINSIICRANLAYNVTLYTNIAKEKGIQCAEEADITDINRSFSLTTPYTKKSVFLSNIW